MGSRVFPGFSSRGREVVIVDIAKSKSRKTESMRGTELGRAESTANSFPGSKVVNGGKEVFGWKAQQTERGKQRFILNLDRTSKDRSNTPSYLLPTPPYVKK